MKLAFLTFGILGAAFAFADSWKAPVPRIFSSPSGEYALKVVPEKDLSKGAMATLFTLDAGGKERVLWKNRLVNIPVTAHITDSARVVTLDTYAQVGYRHAVVIYNDQGRVLKDYRLEDLYQPIEIDAFSRSVSSRWWNEGRSLEWQFDGDYGPVAINGIKVVRPADERLVVASSKLSKKLVFDLGSGRFQAAR